MNRNEPYRRLPPRLLVWGALIAVGCATGCGDGGGATGLSVTTTSTVAGVPRGLWECVVAVRLTSNEPLASLAYDLDYGGPGAQPGEFLPGFRGNGSFGSDPCDSEVELPLTSAIFTDDESNLTMRTAIDTNSFPGIAGPATLQLCTYRKPSGRAPTAADFPLRLIAARNHGDTPLVPTLTVSIERCLNAYTSTTDTSTTQTTTTTTTTTTVPVTQYDIEFELQYSGTLGALQFDVDYSAAGGDFVGPSGFEDCQPASGVAGSIMSVRDDVTASTLSVGFISLRGIVGPTSLLTCTLDTPLGQPAPSALMITVVDASDPDFVPPDPLPSVAIASIGKRR